MGLYDFLNKYNMSFNKLMNIIYDLSKFVYFPDVENTIRWLDDIYNDKEFRELKKQMKQQKQN